LREFTIGADDWDGLGGALSQYDRAVVVGGDGTFHHVAPLARQAGTALGLVPCGTGNALATALNLSVGKSLRLLAQHTEPRPMDLLDLGGETAVFCVGMGLDALVIAALARETVGRWGRLAYVPAVFRARRSAAVLDVSVTVDGKGVYRGPAWECMVTNVANLGSSIMVAPGAKPDDGLLHVSLFEPPMPSAARMMGMLGASAYIRRGVPVDHRWAGKHVVIESDAPAATEVDGEPAGTATRITASAAEAALRVYY